MFIHLLFVAAVAGTPAADAAQAASAAVGVSEKAVSPAMAEAIANKARIKTSVELKKEAPPDYPASEKARNNGGRVLVRGIVTVQGRLAEAEVVRTSASDVLTASALHAAQQSEFYPAKDAQGIAIATPVAIPIDFAFDDVRQDTVTYIAPAYSEIMRTSGMTGKVTIGGFAGADGRLTGAKVLLSSRSAELDAAAMAAAEVSLYRVDRDASGRALETPVRMSYDFVNYRSPGEGGGVLRYSCDQFTKDQTWWRANWPETERGELYYMMAGLAVTMNPQIALDLKAFRTDFETRWVDAIATCQSKTNVLFIDVLKPEGTYAKALAQRK